MPVCASSPVCLFQGAMANFGTLTFHSTWIQTSYQVWQAWPMQYSIMCHFALEHKKTIKRGQERFNSCMGSRPKMQKADAYMSDREL